jgi:hypothetical protein
MTTSFDGTAKEITISNDILSITVQSIYSDWKDWVMLNPGYEQAFRVVGGDPIGGGLYAGVIYFLMNGWKIVIDHTLTIDGILYSDDQSSPYVAGPGVAIATNTVSNLVQKVATSGNEYSLADFWSYNSRTLTSGAAPSANDIATAVRTELTTELDHLMELQNGQGLDSTQAIMLLELYRLAGLDPTKPLVVTNTSRVVNGAGLSQQISSNASQTVVQRV